jgi:tetratricopeptide (TPR) repeat protein
LTPDLILEIYSDLPEPGERLGRLVAATLNDCDLSRSCCSHLLHLFAPDQAPRTTVEDIYLAHFRHLGGEFWKSLLPALTPTMEPVLKQILTAPHPLRWGVTEAMCETSRRVAVSDRSQSLPIARAALVVAAAVPLDFLRSENREELLALAHATVANALRMLDQTQEARLVMDEAETHHVRLGTGLLGLTPRYLTLRASLETWERRYDLALGTLAQAITHPNSASGDLYARLHLQRSSVQILRDQPTLAVPDLEAAVAHLDPDQHPELWCYAMQQRLSLATELKNWQEAEALLPEVERRLREIGDEFHLIRLRWSQARLAEGRDQPEAAEALYLRVREAFLHHGLSYNAALVTVELAALLLRQGRLEEVKTYAAETATEFERQGVEPELIGALTLLEQAVLGQRLTVELLARIRRQINRQKRS